MLEGQPVAFTAGRGSDLHCVGELCSQRGAGGITIYWELHPVQQRMQIGVIFEGLATIAIQGCNSRFNTYHFVLLNFAKSSFCHGKLRCVYIHFLF